jgi:hypothetical protein
MADIPEYKRRHGIEPVAAPIGAEAAVGQLNSASQNAVQAKMNKAQGDVQLDLAKHGEQGHKLIMGRTLANMGSKIADNAAYEGARIRGAEAASTPGQTFLPALNQTDAEFQKSYKQEELASVAFQGKNYLNTILHEASLDPKPSAQTLDAYQKNAAKQLQQLVDSVSPESRKELSRVFLNDYNSGYYQLSNKVEGYNRKYLESQANVQHEQTTENLYNKEREGFTDAAKEEYEFGARNIQQQLEGGRLTPQDANKRLKELRMSLKKGQANREAETAIKDGTYAEFQKNQRENRPKDVTPIEHDEIVAQTMQYANNYQAALEGQQYLTFVDTQTKRLQNSLTPAQEATAKEEMGPKYAAQYDLAVAKVEAKKFAEVEMIREAIGNFGDVVKMSNYSNSDMNTIFDKLIEHREAQIGIPKGSLDLKSQAEMAQQIKREVPILEERLTKAAKFGGPKQATEAAQAMKVLDRNNPVAISDLKSDTRAILDSFADHLSNTTLSPEEALKAARGDVNVDENTKQERIKNWKEYDKTQYPETSKKLRHIADALGAKSGWWIFEQGDASLMPAGLSVAYDRLMTSTAPNYADPKMADKAVLDEMAKVYQFTNTNNRKEVMAFPPEILYPNQESFLHSEKVRQLKLFVDINKLAQEENGFVYNQLGWVENSDNPESDIMLKIDGVDRKIVISSDMATQYGINETPSWAFSYLDENNVPFPLIDINGVGAVKRWSPDFNYLQDKSKDYEASQRAKAVDAKAQYAKDLELRANLFLDAP